MKPTPLPTPVSLSFLTGPLAGQTIAIERAVTTLGREASSDIVIADDPKVSRLHARLLWRDQQWRIENLSQSSFVRVDHQRVRQATLVDGSVVDLGDTTTFVLHIGDQATEATEATEMAAADDPTILLRPPARPSAPRASQPKLPAPPRASHERHERHERHASGGQPDRAYYACAGAFAAQAADAHCATRRLGSPAAERCPG